jgi:putative oxidoreductase
MSGSTPERTPFGEPASAERSAVSRHEAERTTSLRPFGITEPVSTPQWEDPQASETERRRHVVDRFDGAFGLLILRVVTAGIFAIRGLQKLQSLDLTSQQFAQAGVPNAATMAIVVGACEVAIAVALLLGVLVRLAGIGIAIITIGALVYVSWRTGQVFSAGQPGFSGELELLLAAVGLAFAGLGGGGWGVDRRFRRR